ncbi:peroxisome proliferator-activated receptor gamma coactivator 1-alpha-like isoform X3 [Narcine bancroftii]|uniref:peroxisome proliferator-activated receptor gamma coactivator 1-alpha-like isoform X3 n=1 Tax=Narcine bancroftii TaxID=1343680 RepID=UPI0038315D49
MADCSLTDEDFSSFVFNYLTESAESQYGSVAGEDRFYSDFPEIDLSQLDVADLDSVSCLSELHWDNDQTEKSSSQYSTDDSELFETIEEENEALLAALTETLDDIQVDDVSLSAFKELTDGVVTELLETASLPTPDGSPPNTKADEPSLLKKLLLAPQDAHLNYERQKEISTVRHASGSQKSKSQRSFKVDSPQGSKPRSSCQIQHRPFSELHKHLTSTVCPPLFKTEDSKITNKDQSHPVWTSQYHQSHHQQAKPTTLLLSPESESDCKEFPLDNKSFEQALSVELCGTAGLTPPTTPPHKTTRDDPFKTAIKINSSASNTNNRLPSKNHWSSLSKSLVNKHPEQTELYAYLSKATVAPIQMEGKKVKRSYTRCFGDHDYCQLYGSETEMEKNVLRLYELPNSSSHQNVKEECDNYALGGDKKQKMSPISNQGLNDKKMEISEKLSVQSSNNKPMRDQEIRDKLFEHFGYPEEAITDEEVKQNMLEDSDCVSNECCYNSEANLLKAMKKPGASSPDQNLSILLHKTEQSLPKDRLHAQEYQLDGERTMPSSNQQHKLNFGSPHAQARSPAKRESARNGKHDKCLYGKQIWNEEDFENANQRDRRNKAMDDCRIIYIGKLACNITPAELKRRFEVFGEIEECKLLAQDRGVKCGFIAYRYTEDAASALKNGHKLQQHSEPELHLYYGGFCKANYTDLDCSAEDLDLAPMKSKYDTMDFDSLLKEAQNSLTR